MFGPKAAQFSIALFTRGHYLDTESIEDFAKCSDCKPQQEWERKIEAQIKKLRTKYGTEMDQLKKRLEDN
ncbi:GTPase IMAP family member 8 [Labeo rohita]|uniref:GTPase IMAP family member 8 n=1 Tax=Labeo rohita TaxID=84645 RepID=A0ABQ8M3U2_LABRO|nr:GTPase IMAP family member 8 [Labeo rohita]